MPRGHEGVLSHIAETVKIQGDDVTDEDANHAMTGTQLAYLGITDDCVPGSLCVCPWRRPQRRHTASR
jgi:hypothetical protein